MGEGMNYNRWMAGHQIAMAPPLSDGRVEYADGTKPTLDQEARDVTTFLAYVANPEMEQRKRVGVRAVLFLGFLTCLTYAVKRQIWSNVLPLNLVIDSAAPPAGGAAFSCPK